MTIEEIGEIIQKRRKTLKLNQDDLSEISGITSKTIYLLENGKGNPSFQTLQKLLDVVGMEIEVRFRKIEE